MAAGKLLPQPTGNIEGVNFVWSRMAFVGGSHVASGPNPLTQFQPLWDPRLTWASGAVKRRQAVHWSGTGIAANTCVKNFTETTLTKQSLIRPGVVLADGLAGGASLTGKTGPFSLTATLSGWLHSGGGQMLGQPKGVARPVRAQRAAALARG